MERMPYVDIFRKRIINLDRRQTNRAHPFIRPVALQTYLRVNLPQLLRHRRVVCEQRYIAVDQFSDFVVDSQIISFRTMFCIIFIIAG